MALTSIRPGVKSYERRVKKLNKKLAFHAKVVDSVSSLRAKKEISKKKRLRSHQKKLKAYDLSALDEFLPDLQSTPRPQQQEHLAKLNCKSRRKLVEKESKKLTTVLNHPAFQLDPLGAIHQHLQSTQPLSETKQPKRSGRRKKDKKKKHSKSSGPSSMKCEY